MYDKLVLVDVNNVIVKDSRDVSEYIFEAIRSRYGLEAQFDINNYEGLSSKAMLRSILRKNGVPEEDINSRIDGCAEELGYTYYNVTGRDAIKTMDGSRQFLAELKKEGALVGIATGDIEDIVKNKLSRAGLSDYFAFGTYGNNEEDLTKIIKNAISRAVSEFGFEQKGRVYAVTSSVEVIKAALAAGVTPLGVAVGKHNVEQLLSAGAEVAVEDIKKGSKIIKIVFR